MAISLDRIRESNSDLYAGIDDDALAKHLHETYYSDLDFPTFAKAINYNDPNGPGVIQSNVTMPLMKGGAGLLGATGEALALAGAEDTGQFLQNRAAEYKDLFTEQQSVDAQNAAKEGIKFTDENGNFQLPSGSAISQAAFESAPSTVAMGILGAPIAGGLTKAAGAVLPEATSVLTKFLAGTAPSAIGYGASEGVVSGLQNADQTETKFRQTPIDEFYDVPAFLDAFSNETDPTKSDEERANEARDIVARKAGKEVFEKTAVSTGAIGIATGGGGLGMLARDNPASGLLTKLAKGAITEGPLQEGPQSYYEQKIQNIADKKYRDPSIDPNAGAMDAAISGSTIGSIMGLVSAGAGHGVSPNKDAVAKIGGAQTVDDAIAAQTAAVTKMETPTENKADPTQYESSFESAASKYGVPMDFLKAVAMQETGIRQFDKNGKPMNPGTSSALGVMQIIPKWHPQYDPTKLAQDADYNIHAGAEFLGELLKKHDGDMKAAAMDYFGSKNPDENAKYAAGVLSKMQTKNFPNRVETKPTNIDEMWPDVQQVVAERTIPERAGGLLATINDQYREPSGYVPGEQGQVWEKPTAEIKQVEPTAEVKQPWEMTAIEAGRDYLTKRVVELDTEYASAKNKNTPIPVGYKSKRAAWLKDLETQINDAKNPTDHYAIQASSLADHYPAVRKALAEGKPVPQEVLNDYPDLKPTVEVKTTPIGYKFKTGETGVTASGRETTPFPKFATSTGKVSPKAIKNVDEWLIDNAREEALSRGDTFAAKQFEYAKGNIQRADKDSAEDYLFGKDQIDIKPNQLKPTEDNNAKSKIQPVPSNIRTDEENAAITTGTPATVESTGNFSRRKPKNELIFTKPIIGKDGVEVLSYKWAWREGEKFDKNDGGLVNARVSDWDSAVLNSETGKDIVHQFNVKLPNGDVKSVSLETAKKLLGDNNLLGKVRNERNNERLKTIKQLLIDVRKHKQKDSAGKLTWNDYVHPDIKTAYLNLASKIGKLNIQPSSIQLSRLMNTIDNDNSIRDLQDFIELNEKQLRGDYGIESNNKGTNVNVSTGTDRTGTRERSGELGSDVITGVEDNAGNDRKPVLDNLSTDKVPLKSNYHPAIKSMADDLVEGGGTVILSDGTRTASLNPDWYKNGAFVLHNDKGIPLSKTPPVREIKQAVTAWESAKKITKRQDKILRVLSDQAEAMDQEDAADDFEAMNQADDFEDIPLTGGSKVLSEEDLFGPEKVAVAAPKAEDYKTPAEYHAARLAYKQSGNAVESEKSKQLYDLNGEIKKAEKKLVEKQTKGEQAFSPAQAKIDAAAITEAENKLAKLKESRGDLLSSYTESDLKKKEIRETEKKVQPEMEVNSIVDEFMLAGQTTDVFGMKSPMEKVKETEPTTIESHDKIVSKIDSGNITADKMRSEFENLVSNRDAILVELSKLTKAQLENRIHRYLRPDATKTSMIEDAYESMLTDYWISKDTFSYSVDFMSKEPASTAIAKKVKSELSKLTDERIKEYANGIAKSKQEREEHKKEVEAGMENPKTLDDYSRVLRKKMDAGMTYRDARLSLTPEQRVEFDLMSAEKTRNDRVVPATDIKTTVQTTTGDIIETKHTKTGEDLFVVKAADRVEREIYNQWNATAKRLGGWYSSFRGAGAVPGFQFKTKENAEAFLKYLGGDVDQARDAVQARRDSFADDKTQSAVERLNEMADRLENKADESLNQDRKANTARRAGMAARAEANANAEKALAVTMRNIANSIDTGTTKFLDKVRQKTQVELLQSIVNVAKYDQLRKTYSNYADYEKHRDDAPTNETADFIEHPSYTVHRSELAKLGRALIEVNGTKKIGKRVLDVADDVSKAYLDFAKKNLDKVHVFSTKDGKATFKSKAIAEEAISRSGFKGAAIVLPFKRAENLIILSPAEAMSRGIWSGDDDKLITLTPSFGRELVEAVGKAARRNNAVSVPWQFERTYEQRKRLSSMGLETPAELRAAAREFIGLMEQAEKPSKIKQMEREMIGRKNDGLDFFPTPAAVADEMVDIADIKEGMRVLEPSAGMGHIAERIREYGTEPDVVEMANDRKELLEEKGFNVVGRDFMEVTDNYDRIIMNPPFSDRRDMAHVQHAYDLLNNNGRLVAIMGEGVFFGSDKKAQGFRDWLDKVGGTVEKLPEGTFQDASLPVNTSVNARLVVIDKTSDVKFSKTTDTIEIDGVYRSTKNSNGKLLAPTKEGIKNFWEWFGDSKVVDKQGRPLVVYHGSPNKFKEFDVNKIGSSTDDGMHGKGFYFSESKTEAAKWGSNIDEFYLNAPAPFVVKEFDSVQNTMRSAGYFDSSNEDLPLNLVGQKTAKPNQITTILIEKGFDSVVKNERDSVNEYVVFNPNQIKSATDINFSKSTDTTGTTVSDLKGMLPKRVDDLVRAGKLNVVQSVDELPQAMQDSGDILYHTVWHGSPHDHNKFDSSKIGTGERAQAFGYGHYFTDKKEIAQWYRDKLAELDFSKRSDGEGISKELQEKLKESFSYLTRRSTNKLTGADIIEDVINQLPENSNLIKEANQVLRYPPRFLGKLYQVELAPTQDEYLDWDKPLSKQSEKVKAALGDIYLPAYHTKENTTGANFYKFHARESSDVEASQYLHSLGIRGIRYKAEAGKSDASNYVIFSDDDITISAKFSKDLAGVEALYDKTNDKLYLVADMLNKDNLNQVLTHELLHRALATDKNVIQTFDRFKSGLEERFNMALDGKGSKFEIEAATRVMDAGTPIQDRVEEFGAYLVTQYQSKPASLSGKIIKAIKDFIAAVKIYLVKNGLDMGFIKSLTPADLVAMSGYGAKVNSNVSLGGESKLVYSFAGKRSNTADEHALSTAQDRIDVGENAETVRQDTGWHEGVDGKWRYEISDAEAKLKKPYPEQGQRFGDVARDLYNRQLEQGEFERVTVGDILDHPKLFAAYPKLADINVTTQEGKGAAISVGSPWTIYIGEDVVMSNVKSTLLHELQHGIQTIEGFASGGSQDAAMNAMSANEFRALWDSQKEIVKQQGFVDDASISMTAWKRARLIAYKNLAGEVEARNVQARAKMNDDFLRMVPPAETADVPDTDVIVKWNGMKMDMAIPKLSNETLDNLIYKYQDRFIGLKRQQQKTAPVISDETDTYLAEELYSQRKAQLIKEFNDKQLDPLLKEMNDNKIDLDTFQRFLQARHAESRNAVMAERNPNQDMIDDNIERAQLALENAKTTKESNDAMRELRIWENAKPFRGSEEDRLSLSGMSDDTAQAILDEADPIMFELGDKVDAITQGMLNLLVDYGMETEETVDALKEQWDHYVPLHRDEAHPEQGGFGQPIGQGFSVSGSGMKQATGSNADVTNILAHLSAAREQMITRGEKNLVTKTLAKFIEENPDPDFAEVNTPDIQNKLVNGLVEPVAANYFVMKQKPNVVSFRVDGKDSYIVFNENKQSNMDLAASMQNLDGADLDRIEKIMAKGTRWFASINTQYNLAFGLFNFIRDMGATALNLTTTPLHGKQLAVLSRIPKALATITKSLRSGNYDPEYQEFLREGGAIGFTNMFENIEARNKSITDKLKLLDESGPVKFFHQALPKFLNDFNTIIEHSTRFSAYQEAKAVGLTNARAASLAKNLTVNFNRKGANTTKLAAYYAFLNASIQGTARTVETLRGPSGKQILMGGTGLGMIMTVLGIMNMGADDWDKIPEFVKERSLILTLPGMKGYVAIPLPMGFNIIPNVGRKFVESFIGSNKISNTKRFGDLAGSVIGAFSPLGGGDLVSSVTPTTLDPAIDLLRNQDWTGKPIYRDDFNSLKPSPGFTRTKENTAKVFKNTAEAINWATGGTQAKQGLWSPTGDQLSYVVGQLTGGTGREAMKVLEAGQSLYTGEELPIYRIPIVGKFAGKTTGAEAERAGYYDNIKTMYEHKEELETLAPKDRINYLRNNPEARYITALHKIESSVDKLKRQRKVLIEKSANTKALDQAIVKQMTKYNMLVDKAMR